MIFTCTRYKYFKQQTTSDVLIEKQLIVCMGRLYRTRELLSGINKGNRGIWYGPRVVPVVEEILINARNTILHTTATLTQTLTLTPTPPLPI